MYDKDKIPKKFVLIGPIGPEKDIYNIDNNYWNFSNFQLDLLRKIPFIDRLFLYYFDNGFNTLQKVSKAKKRRPGPYVFCYMTKKGSRAIKLGFSKVLDKVE